MDPGFRRDDDGYMRRRAVAYGAGLARAATSWISAPRSSTRWRQSGPSLQARIPSRWLSDGSLPETQLAPLRQPNVTQLPLAPCEPSAVTTRGEAGSIAMTSIETVRFSTITPSNPPPLQSE